MSNRMREGTYRPRDPEHTAHGDSKINPGSNRRRTLSTKEIFESSRRHGAELEHNRRHREGLERENYEEKLARTERKYREQAAKIEYQLRSDAVRSNKYLSSRIDIDSIRKRDTDTMRVFKYKNSYIETSWTI